MSRQTGKNSQERLIELVPMSRKTGKNSLERLIELSYEP